ncbi:phage tail length tape measure family protein [Halomonas sp. JS92-SW72]|uniref:phage tail length tape measure family protein n=1 Tax=Halomonas sp. JS92-SW72 TaxID=2306583 RepID=UPI000E5BA8A9|nr:phage tail length tape measure family protein [Halomonas sp. JS92-SW72]AXY41595.1 hypothetical protein D1793_04945 [Halomonas sp. JS92-SW72]
MAMAGNDLRLGVRLEADPSNLRAGTEQGVREVRRLTEQTQRSGQQARGAARETRSFSDSMRNAASASAVLHGPLGGVASRFSSIATLASRAGVAMGGAGLAASAGVMGYVSFTRAAGEAERQLLRIEARLQATGNAAGVSAQEINAFARQLAEDTLTSAGAVREAAAELLGFSNVTREDFFRTLTLAQDLGGNLASNVQQLGRVLEAPEEGLGRLARRMTDLSFEQREMIREMVESGRQAEAMGVILEHLERQIGGTGAGEAAGLAGATDTLGERWTRLKENLGDTGPVTNATNAMSGLLGTLNQYLEARRGLEQEGFSGLPGPLGLGVTALQLRNRAGEPTTPRVDTSGPEALQRAQQAAEAAAGRRLDRIREIESEANNERVEIERTANERIIAERDRMLRELEGLAAQGGINDADLASARASVEARAAAAIEAAERPAREAAERRAQAEAERAAGQAASNQQVLQGLQREKQLLDTLAGTERDRAQAMDAAAARLNEFASPAQIEQARTLAGLIHDAMEAEQRQAEIRAAQDDLDLRIAQQQLLAQFAGEETQEYRLQAALLELKHRVGEVGARQLEEQVRLAHELTRANQEQLEQQRNLEGILDRADPTRALERQLELIEELKRQFPEYAAALDQAYAQVSQRIEEINRGLLSTTAINRQFTFGAARGLDSFAEDLANGRNAIDSLADAFRQFAADFLLQIARMIAQQAIFNALQAMGGGSPGGIISGLLQFHGGGVVGQGGTSRDLFGTARRYHTGGIAGLAPDEVPAILRRGEEVLTAADPRHRDNQGGGAPNVSVKNVNVFDAVDVLEQAMADTAGQKVQLNYVRSNRSAWRNALGL